jgi:hypothetical protein
MPIKIKRTKGSRVEGLSLLLYILVFAPLCFGFWIYSISRFIYSVFYSWLGLFNTICDLLLIIFIPFTSILFLFLFIAFLKLVGFRYMVWGHFIFRLIDEGSEESEETDDHLRLSESHRR